MSKNKIRVALLALFLSGLWLTSALASGGGGGASVVTVQNSDGTIIATNSGGTVTVSRPAITGDFSIPSASNVGTLANVNSNVGTYNGITINAKGQVTGAVAGIHLGTSCAAANPNASGQADLGLSTDNTNLFVCADITSTPTQVAEFGPNGLTLPLLTPSTLLGLNGSNQVINITSIPSGTTLSIGTSAAATNPQRNGQPGTGLYSAATGTVSIAGAGSDVADFSSAGEALHLGSYSGAATGLTGTAAGLSVGGNAATATALAAAPSGCTAGQFVTQISANGTPTCGAPSGSGYVAGPGSSTVGYASLWSNTAGTALGVGLPVATTGNSTIVETSSGGLISASIVPTLNQNTTGNAGSSSLITTNSSTANSTFYFLGAGSTTNSNQAATLGSGLSFNPSTSAITATTFNGALVGNSSTATALASAPSGCSAGSFVTQISANGTPTCATPATSGYVSGPGTTTSGYLPAWGNTTGTTLGVGLPVGTTGNSTVVETSSGGLIASSIVPTLNQNTTGTAGNITATSNSTLTALPDLALPLSQITGFGTGVATALGDATNAAGGLVTYSGALGTPTSGVATNLTGTATALNIGGNAATVTTNANLTGPITSVGNATSVAGAGAGKVLAGATPSMTATPTLGVNASTTGTIGLANGNASGVTTTIEAAQTTGTPWTLNLPSSAGTSGYCLETDGTGVTTWSSCNAGTPTGWISAGAGGGTDDCPGIQTAINTAETNGNGVVVFAPGATYNCPNSGFTFDPTQVSFVGNGATINAASMTTGPLVSDTQTSSLGQTIQLKNSMQGLNFVGPTSGGTTVDLLVFNTTTSGNYSSKYSFKNITAVGFRHDEVYENGAYLIHFDNISYRGAVVSSVYSPSGFTNSGENISHDFGVIFQTPVGIDSENNAGSQTFSFKDTSFDNDTVIANVQAGSVIFFNPWWEMNGTTELTTPPVVVGNTTGANVRVYGGTFDLDGTGPFSGASSLFNVGASGALNIDSMFLNNTALTSGALATGAGHINITNTQSLTVAQGNYEIEGVGGTYSNYMSDGGFENSSIEDLVFIFSDTQPITNRITGANIALTNDSATCGGHTGSQSLKLNKTFGSGSNAGAYIAVPMGNHAMPIGNFWYSKPGSQTGTVFLNYYYVQILGYDGNGIPIIGKSSSTLGLTTVTLSSSALSWTQMQLSQNPSNVLPSWATHVVVQVNLNSMNAGAFCIDDFVVNSL